jgi:hypothetical protein
MDDQGSSWSVRLRALAAFEVELDEFIAEQVGEARRAGLPWDDVARAMGMSRPSAWRRWKSSEEDPRPTRPLRRDVHRLTLESADFKVVQELTSELADRVTSPQKRRPWARAVRAALESQRFAFDVVQRDARETEYRVRQARLQITCLEATQQSKGGVNLVVHPSPELSLERVASPRSAQLRGENAMSEAGEVSVQRVTQFIREQINLGPELLSGS